MPTKKKETTPDNVIDILTVEDEEERRIIDAAKAILRTDFGYGNPWFKEMAAYQAAGFLAVNRDVLVEVPIFDPLLAHFQAGDYKAAERHLLAKWGIEPHQKKGWIPNALER